LFDPGSDNRDQPLTLGALDFNGIIQNNANQPVADTSLLTLVFVVLFQITGIIAAPVGICHKKLSPTFIDT
jgi:hypothetical protein